MIEKLSNVIEKFLFSKNWTCNICGNEVFSNEFICDDCAKTIVKNNGPCCEVCGRSLPNVSPRCASCNNGWNVDFSRSAYIYCDGIAELIKRFKYSNHKYLSDVFIPEMVSVYVKNAIDCDYIVSVPISKSRRDERGFNQSEFLAKSIANRVGRDYFDNLVKKKDTLHQAELDYKHRSENLKNSFSIIDKSKVNGKRILIVDDVLTTGATSNEIATLMKKYGAEWVGLLTIASTILRV